MENEDYKGKNYDFSRAVCAIVSIDLRGCQHHKFQYNNLSGFPEGNAFGMSKPGDGPGYNAAEDGAVSRGRLQHGTEGTWGCKKV